MRFPHAMSLFRKGMVVFLGLLVLFLLWSADAFFGRSDFSGPPFLLTVSHGTPFRVVVGALARRGLITKPETVILWGDVLGIARAIREGDYEISGEDRPFRIFWNLVAGQRYYRRLTVPEGFTVAQVAARMARLGIGTMDRDLSLMSDPAFIGRLRVPSTSLEGYLFPNTYYFSRGTSPREVLTMMVSRFWHVVTPGWRDQSSQQGLSLAQAVILASIVQKEAGTARDMPIVAGVFLNRLHNRMKLQSDPTVLYVMPGHHRLSASDLRIDSPYNTYLHDGLPPTPISNPGAEALHAVLFAEKVPYLYFVSAGPGTPSIFSRTLADHDRAILRIIKDKRRAAREAAIRATK
ncbi:MAG: endolytic transglycosylase MltG [Leptospirales bacterium]